MKRTVEIAQILLWLLGIIFLILASIDVIQPNLSLIQQLNIWIVEILNLKKTLNTFLPIGCLFIALSNVIGLIRIKMFPKTQIS